MKRVFLVLLSVVLLVPLVLLPMTGCATDPSKAIKALQESVASLVSAVNDLASDMGQLQSDVGTLQRDMDDFEAGDTTELLDRLDELDVVISELDDVLVDLQDDVADLQENGNGGGSSSNGDTNGEFTTTRWTPSVEFDNLAWSEADYNLSLDRRPSTIREEDTYRMKVEVTNPVGGTAILLAQDNVALWVHFSPSARDTSIDTGNTGLYFMDSDGLSSHGSLFWDVEYSPSDGVECRWMEFVSEEFDVNELLDGESFYISFDFDLYYK